MLNFPHNPTGAVLDESDLDALESIVRETGVLLLSDEVYEHIVFDGKPHASLSRRPLLAEHAFVISSFGKTYHTTGWKVGYCCAPRQLNAELRGVTKLSGRIGIFILNIQPTTRGNWRAASYDDQTHLIGCCCTPTSDLSINCASHARQHNFACTAPMASHTCRNRHTENTNDNKAIAGAWRSPRQDTNSRRPSAFRLGIFHFRNKQYD